MRSWRVPVLVGCMWVAVAIPAAAVQDVAREIRDSQLRLEEIRGERERLQEEMTELRERVRDVSGELATVMRLRATSAGALRELEFQSGILQASVEATTRQLEDTRERLQQRTHVLHQRLRWIYKHGSVHTAQVLLGARSFSDLLNRYRYLQVIALYDRTLVREIGRLELDLLEQDRFLRSNLALLETLRAEQLNELAELRSIESQQERVLQSARAQERALAERLEQLARDEAQITSLISTLEQRRREEERRAAVAGAPAPAAGSITLSDLGLLRWPVDGRVIYDFGTEVRPDGVRLRWNGMGIGAPAGTPVVAVETGTVVMAAPLEGYGPSVVVSHGDGYYTLYLRLATLVVRESQLVEAGQVIGGVGGERTPEGPHIEFRVHAPGPGGSPVPVDPSSWLRGQSLR